MKALRAMAAAAALSASLLGTAGPAVAENYIDDVGGGAAYYGPTCYGSNYSYHVWNLFAPMDVFGVDSCTAAQLVATRNLAGNYANYIALVSARVPLFVPNTVYAMFWNTSNGLLAMCASYGTGVEFTMDDRNGMVLECHAQ